MTERTSESSQPQDLSGLLASVPRGAIELLGEDQIILTESLLALTSALAELSQRPNPFESPRAQFESPMTPQVRQALNEIDRIRSKDYDEGVSAETSAIARAWAPVIRTGVRDHVHFLTDNYIANTQTYGSVRDRVWEMAPDDAFPDPQRVVAEMPALYDDLEAVADNLAAPQVGDDLKEILHAEYTAWRLDAKAAVILKRPDLQTELDRLWKQIISTPKKNRRIFTERIDTRRKFEEEIVDEGKNQWRVRRSHRSHSESGADLDFAENTIGRLAVLKENGRRLHLYMTSVACDASLDPLEDSFGAITELKQRFTQDYIDQPAFWTEISSSEEALQAALEAERYIVERAERTEKLGKTVKAKLDPKGRGTLHELKEPIIERRLKQLGEAATKANGNPFEKIEADPEFRRQCRDARDILVGGGRIEHPLARQLAENLHKLHFGQQYQQTFMPEESGTIVGIITQRVDSLMAVVERLEADAQDIQLQKLKVEVPDQYQAIAGFKIDPVLRKLMAVLGDAHDSQALASVMPYEAYAHLKQKVEELWALRQLQDEAEQKVS